MYCVVRPTNLSLLPSSIYIYVCIVSYIYLHFNMYTSKCISLWNPWRCCPVIHMYMYIIIHYTYIYISKYLFCCGMSPSRYRVWCNALQRAATHCHTLQHAMLSSSLSLSVYMCVCTCMYISIYIYMYTYIYVYVHIYIKETYDWHIYIFTQLQHLSCCV